ncbi:LIM domain-containing protein PLIM2c-like [Impatiens glandulifera]|uniref:LIM domain-containing protein PLIM2c-like n=1 Tax=Impatiens glandulifera TaxID=253017 RepID=UPI001FB16441|nr:LIM domain-containing protein PLIM2c-like [Impatiens glandulifera]
MAFTGTLDKCKACDKTVYFVDLLTADGVTYHKYCFKCSHCKGTLVMSNYSSMDGVLYCKTHFEQLFKESGNFSKNFQSSGKPERENSLTKAHKLSSLFSGTIDKCPACGKIVYPLEKVTMEGESFHKSCFKCAHGGCPLTHSSYAALNGVLYCKHHFAQLFMEKGSYSHVLEATTHHRRSSSVPSIEIENDLDEPIKEQPHDDPENIKQDDDDEDDKKNNKEDED